MNNSYLSRVQIKNNTFMVQFKNEYSDFMCKQKDRGKINNGKWNFHNVKLLK